MLGIKQWATCLFLHMCSLSLKSPLTGGVDVKVRCDDAAVIYINGTEVGRTSNFSDVWSQEVTANASTIAISCRNNGGDAGLIALFGNRLTTDNTWRCSQDSAKNWYDENFDDSDWDGAYVIQANDGSGTAWPKDNEFPDNAKWIRGSSTFQTSSYSYCRGKLTPLVTIRVFCYNEGRVYVDGEDVGESNARDLIRYRSQHPRLVAVQCTNTSGSDGAVLVSISDRTLTNNTWRVETSKHDDWMELTYREDHRSNWTVPHVLGTNVEKPNGWPYREGYGDNATWLWTSADTGVRRTTYFRGNLGVSVDSRCDDRGTLYADGSKLFNFENRALQINIIPKATRVVSIQGHNGGGRAFIVAGFSNGFKTDTEKWNCTAEWSAGWNTVHYDDSHWSPAKDMQRSDIQADFVTGEKAIWTRVVKDNSYVYCRGYLECGCEYRCQPHSNGFDFECLCPDGFVVKKDGTGCDFDECAQNITVCFHACINTEGSYLCSCNVGFEFANDNYTCINIDECARNISNCSFKCNDTNGSFLCLCPDGFKLDSDMVTCVDINECTTTSHGCSDECVNSEGSYRCQCPQGYSLEWQDGRGTCRDDNECEPGGHDCLEEMNEECKNTPGSFECVCTEGYELSTDRGSPTCERISATNSDSDSNSVDTAVTAGIAAFIFVSVGPTCFLLVFLLRRRRRQKKKTDSSLPNNTPPSRSAEEDLPHVYCNIGREMKRDEANAGSSEGRVTVTYAEVSRKSKPIDPTKSSSGTTLATAVSTKEEHGKENEDYLLPVPVKDVGVFPTPPSTRPTGVFPLPASTPKPAPPSKRMVKDPSPDADTVYGNVSKDQLVSKPIKVQNLANYVQTMGESRGFYNELKTIPSGQKGKCMACERKGVKEKLRFKNIKPYDHSIVTLTTLKDEPLSDFINANFINGFQKPNYYIATQGPTKGTLVSFWRMVWEQQVSLVVMVTGTVEGAKEICHQYWPDKDVGMYGDISVRAVKEEILADFTFRSFTVERNSERREMKHFQYTSWPDKSVPETCTSILNFRRHVKCEEEAASPPVVVHCSAGIGRTGTYIAIDYLLKQAEAEGIVDVVGCVNLMRENRMDMVQTSAQYAFIHTAVVEALLVGNVTIPCSDLVSRIRILGKLHQASNTTGYEDQFKLLENLKPNNLESNFHDARLPKNQSKNRDSKIIPADDRRIFLKQRSGISSDYINAVFVDGYRSRREFIVTQMPLSNTSVDIWRLVEDFGISIVVMLNDMDTKDKGLYFPEGSDPLTLGLFTVTSVAEQNETNSVRCRDLQVQTPKQVLAVSHVSVVDWPETEPLLSGSSKLIRIFHEVQQLKQRQSKKRPVLVHCLDGAARSGLFCATYMILEKIHTEREVDVFNAVKNIRTARPQFVNSVEQYIFLHEMAQEYMDTFELYANFK